MAPLQQAKQKAYRIPHDYHRSTDPTERAKLIATCIALCATLIVVGYLLFAPGSPEKWHSPGPVAQPHALIEHNCQACHVDFTPVRSDAAGPLASDQSERASVQKCQHCHQVAGHWEQGFEMSWQGIACAECHFDHQGRDFQLTRVADTQCVACHGDIRHHSDIAPGFELVTTNVTSFPGDHPEFGSLETDRGLIKFPHDVHLKPGQPRFDTENGSYTQGIKKLSDLSQNDQIRYRKPSQTDDLVRLDCADCHRTVSDLVRVDAALPAQGRHMQPIRYESHCQTCHPLALASGEKVPHGLSLLELEKWLTKEFTPQILSAEYHAWMNQKHPQVPVPGEPEPEQLRSLNDKLTQQVEQALVPLRAACAECHYQEQGEIVVAQTETASGWIGGKQPLIPATWLRHAEFDHGPHRAVACTECHAGAALDISVTKGPQASHDHRDVLMPGKALCARCHGPATATGGGARFDCAECHRYHGGSSASGPFWPRESAPAETLSIEALLHGSHPQE